MVYKLYDRTPGHVEWQHTLSITNEEKEIVDEVIEGYKKQSIEVSFSSALRHIIREYKKMKERA